MSDVPVIEVVRGEQQPWTDDAGFRPPAGGAVLARLLDDVLPEVATALVLGPHAGPIIEAVAARCAQVTVLLRSVSDATTLAETAPANVTVITGALDGLPDGSFDAVIAADGLDRVLSADSDDIDWLGRLALLTRQASGAKLLLIGCENAASLPALLDRRPADERHGDDEWRPLFDDPSRPGSPAAFASALTAAGLAPARLFGAYGSISEPATLLDIDAAASTVGGSPALRLAVDALSADASSTPLAAPISGGADTVVRGGLLGAMAPSWISLYGASGSALYCAPASFTDVIAASLDDGAWVFAPAASEAPVGEGLIVVNTAARPARVPDTESVERQLFRLAAAEDVPAFRAYAGRIGAWVRAQDATRVTCLDDLYLDGDTFAPGTFGLVATGTEAPDALLAAAWHRFQDRLLKAHRRHPWPPWVVGDDLVALWLGMSGVEGAKEAVARGRVLAEVVSPLVDPAAEQGATEADVRTALADAAEARKQSMELAGQVFGLERTIGFRDRQLKAREKVVRELRQDMRSVAGSRAYKLAGTIRKVSRVRKPRDLAKALKKKLRR